jgi:hypothetical protein
MYLTRGHQHGGAPNGPKGACSAHYALRFLATGVLTVRLAARPGPLGALALIAIGAAAVSALARSIGILRWLTGSVVPGAVSRSRATRSCRGVRKYSTRA